MIERDGEELKQTIHNLPSHSSPREPSKDYDDEYDCEPELESDYYYARED